MTGLTLRSAAAQRVAIVYAILLGMVILVSFVSPTFRTVENLGNVLVQCVPLAIVSLGQTFVVLAGGIDLSVGSVISLTTSVASVLMAGAPWGVGRGLLGVAALFLAAGLFNGVSVAVMRIPPLITTLSCMTILQGLSLWYRPAPGGFIPPQFAAGITARWGLLSVPLALLLAVLGLGAYLLYLTPFGRHVYAVGGNRRLAESAGVDTRRVTLDTYLVSALAAVVAGLILSGRIRAGDPVIGAPFALDSVTAVVIGGTSLAGGRGDLLGSAAGAFIIGMLSNILNLLGVSSFYQYVLKGSVLVVAMVVYSLAGGKEGETA